MRFAALRYTNNQDFQFALIWSEIASLYEFVGAVKRHLANGIASNRQKDTETD